MGAVSVMEGTRHNCPVSCVVESAISSYKCIFGRGNKPLHLRQGGAGGWRRSRALQYCDGKGTDEAVGRRESHNTHNVEQKKAIRGGGTDFCKEVSSLITG